MSMMNLTKSSAVSLVAAIVSRPHAIQRQIAFNQSQVLHPIAHSPSLDSPFGDTSLMFSYAMQWSVLIKVSFLDRIRFVSQLGCLMRYMKNSCHYDTVFERIPGSRPIRLIAPALVPVAAGLSMKSPGSRRTQV